jgi:hypothetical protein
MESIRRKWETRSTRERPRAGDGTRHSPACRMEGPEGIARRFGPIEAALERTRNGRARRSPRAGIVVRRGS